MPYDRLITRADVAAFIPGEPAPPEEPSPTVQDDPDAEKGSDAEEPAAGGGKRRRKP